MGDQNGPKLEEEWVIIPDHHPAIFSSEEHTTALNLLSDNSRLSHLPGHGNTPKQSYVFSGLCYCAKCGSRLWNTPGRKHSDGYTTGIYSCPTARKASACDSSAVNDLAIGEFVLNYVLNMLSAKTHFSEISSVDELQHRLLRGSTFDGVLAIESSGLNEFYELLSHYSSDDSYFFKPKPTKKASVNPEVASLKKEKQKQERALKRLHDLFLFSEKSMSEKDFIIQKGLISSRIEAINSQLGLLSASVEETLSDEDFVRLASHLLINKQLQNKTYIFYKEFVQNVSPEVLSEFFHSIIDNIRLYNGRVCSIVFKNGLTHIFEWEKK